MPESWFLSFLWKRPSADVWTPSDALIPGEHPIDYIGRAQAANPDCEFRILFFAPVPTDVYRRATGI